MSIVLKPAIFISHSAKEPASLALLDALEGALTALGFEVLLDRTRLQAGQLWRQEIHTWMSRCHGAVILFSKNAYDDSDWVLKEATILSWRLALDPQFTLVPVLFPPVEGPWLSKGRYEPLALGEVQAIDSRIAGDVVSRILARLTPLLRACPQTPLDDVLFDIAALLRGVAPAALQSIAVKLGKTIPWDPAADTADQFAREILHVDLARVKDVMLELQPSIGIDAAVKIVEYVAPYCIDPMIAAPVARVALRDPATPPRDAVALNATDADVGNLHIQRARQRRLPWIVIPVVAGGGADHAGSYLRQIREEMSRREDLHDIGVRPALAKAVMNRARLDGDPYFILLQTYVGPAVLKTLRAEFPDCTLVVLTGDSGTAAYEKKNAGVWLLRPLLDRDAEIDLIVLLRRAREIARRPPAQVVR